MQSAINSLKNVTIEATVIRADGTKEELGLISDMSADTAESGSALFKFIKKLGGITNG